MNYPKISSSVRWYASLSLYSAPLVCWNFHAISFQLNTFSPDLGLNLRMKMNWNLNRKASNVLEHEFDLGQRKCWLPKTRALSIHKIYTRLRLNIPGPDYENWCLQEWNSSKQILKHMPTPTGMMTSSNGSIFRVTGHLCGEFTGPRWIPHTKASDAELWCFLWSAPE